MQSRLLLRRRRRGDLKLVAVVVAHRSRWRHLFEKAAESVASLVPRLGQIHE
jgi:hypothetical protein